MRNHAGNDSGGECGVAVASRFTMPDTEAGGGRNRHSAVRSNAPFWYSFEYGSAHFTVISTEHDTREGSAQRRVSSMPRSYSFCVDISCEIHKVDLNVSLWIGRTPSGTFRRSLFQGSQIS